MVRRTIVGVALAVPLIGGCEQRSAAQSSKQQEGGIKAPDEVVAVTVAPVRVQSVQRGIDVVGSLFGDEQATIAAKVPGRVTEIVRDVGDVVQSGEVLAQIEPTDYELAVSQKRMAIDEVLARLGLKEMPKADFDPARVPTVERAKLQAANAEAKLQRAEQLHKQTPPLISEQDYQDIRTAFEVAKSDHDVALLTARSLVAQARSRKSELDQALQRLADATVRAPFKAEAKLLATRPSQRGYAVAERIVSVGEYVQEGAALFRLVASDPIKYRARVPERFTAQAKVGQSASIAVDAYPGRAFAGKVARVSPQIDPDTRTFLVEVLIPNPDNLLLPGAFARGELMTHVDEGVVFVPEAAVVSFAGVNKVFTVENGKAVEVRIEPGMKRDGYVEIRKGVKPGTREVVVGGVNKLATGTPVNVQRGAEAKSE